MSRTAAPAHRAFGDRHTVALTTYRRDGRPVTTPVSLVHVGDRAFIRTWATAGKMKRLRNDPRLTVAPSTFRGQPTGPAVPARARPIEGEDALLAARALAKQHPILHGVLVPLAHRMRRYRTVHLELVPLDPAEGDPVSPAPPTAAPA